VKRTSVSIVLGLLALLLNAGRGAMAQQFELSWYTIDGGGGMFSSGGSFELGGTVGQPDAAIAVLYGGPFQLSGGFWAAAAAAPCLGDLNGDRRRDLADLAILLAAYGVSDDGDIDGDGDTDLADLAILLANYGVACP
jgi:hypothetical protein